MGILLLLGAVICVDAVAQGNGSSPAGVVAGRVVEAGTLVPIESAHVTVEGMGQTALTDAGGRFRIAGVAVGTHSVRAEYIGRVPTVRTDVVVRAGRVTTVELELSVAPIGLEGLRAAPSYFDRGQEGGASRIGFEAEEIRRAPGSAGDVSRILYGLPGVAKVNDQSNGLAVRGGTPSENLFLVDGIAMPNINHFPAQGASSGPIGVLNVELIRNVELHAGGFGAQYGDRLSSVLELSLREGGGERHQAQLGLDFTGVGAVLEGPVGGRASYVTSVRRSYLDVLVKMVDVGASVAPRYGDYQAKLSAELTPRHRLGVLGVWADDRFSTDLEQAHEHAMTAFGRQDLMQGTTGVTWTALWRDGWLSRTSLAHGYARFDEDYTETASRAPLFHNRSTEQSVTLRNVTRVQLGRTSSISFGGDVAWRHARYANQYLRHVNPIGDTVPELRLDAAPGGVHGGVFASVVQQTTPKLATTLGVRLDHATLTRSTTLSPRASLAYALSERSTLSGAVGVYRQALPLVMLAHAPHRALRDPLAVHVVAGYSQLLAPHTRLTLEAYRKEYHRLPLDARQPTLMPLDEVVLGSAFFTVRDRLEDTGRARADGVELMLQKKLTGRMHALVSGAYASARYRGLDGVWRPRAFDNGVIVSAEGGYRLGERWELSARWIYAGGPPYTPIDVDRSRVHGRTILHEDRTAAARFPAYHSLNVRADRRFVVGSSNVVAYLSVWNAYDRRNVASYYWNAESAAADVTYQWRRLPVFGVEWAF